MNPKALEEFQYIYGDPRPYLFRYLEQMPNVETTTALTPTKTSGDVGFSHSEVFQFICDKGKRVLAPPAKIETVGQQLENGSEPILLIPILLKNRVRCRSSNTASHLNIFLYNRLTQELERIDIKKYHLDGFNLKLLLKKVLTVFIPDYLPEASFVPELDVPLPFIRKHRFESAADAFPLWLMAYLTIRCRKPDYTSKKAQASVGRLSTKTVKGIWDKYIHYRNGLKHNCENGKIENPMTKRCLLPLSPVISTLVKEKPPKGCKEGLEYNNLLRKCVKKGTLADVNVLLDEAMTVNLEKEKGFVHLDRDPIMSLGIMNFILRKFPYARFICPADKGKKIQKSDFKIRWKYDHELQQFVLTIPKLFWTLWEEGIQDPNSRFLIAFIGLVSKQVPPGFHANVLIFDKANNELERFDGLGRDIHENYGIDLFDKKIVAEFDQRMPRPIKYFTPLDYCPRMAVFQSKEIDEIPGKDLRGNCAVWRMWYVHLRMANPHLPRKDLVKMAHNKLMQTGSLYKFIKSYQTYLVQSYKKMRREKKPKAEAAAAATR